jgi:hypothetical protein
MEEPSVILSDLRISNIERVLSFCIGVGLAFRGIAIMQEDDELAHGIGFLATGSVLMARGITGRSVECMLSKIF